MRADHRVDCYGDDENAHRASNDCAGALSPKAKSLLACSR